MRGVAEFPAPFAPDLVRVAGARDAVLERVAAVDRDGVLETAVEEEAEVLWCAEAEVLWCAEKPHAPEIKKMGIPVIKRRILLTFSA